LGHFGFGRGRQLRWPISSTLPLWAHVLWSVVLQ
jgi:hypothetical protein